jgi:hypothetical protein
MAPTPAHSTTPSSVPKSARRVPIYIVDENSVTRGTLRAFLTREGYTRSAILSVALRGGKYTTAK